MSTVRDPNKSEDWNIGWVAGYDVGYNNGMKQGQIASGAPQTNDVHRATVPSADPAMPEAKATTSDAAKGAVDLPKPLKPSKKGSKKKKSALGVFRKMFDYKDYKDKNPNATFGERSQYVATAWKGLTAEEKEMYQKKADEINASPSEAGSADPPASKGGKGKKRKKSESELIRASTPIPHQHPAVRRLCVRLPPHPTTHPSVDSGRLLTDRRLPSRSSLFRLQAGTACSWPISGRNSRSTILGRTQRRPSRRRRPGGSRWRRRRRTSTNAKPTRSTSTR